eukprot:COSAG03_NODE_20997_length_310_cov_1.099526_1_plen_68_part_01
MTETLYIMPGRDAQDIEDSHGRDHGHVWQCVPRGLQHRGGPGASAPNDRLLSAVRCAARPAHRPYSVE